MNVARWVSAEVIPDAIPHAGSAAGERVEHTILLVVGCIGNIVRQTHKLVGAVVARQAVFKSGKDAVVD